MLLSQRACKRVMCVIFSSWLLMWMFSLSCWKRQKQKWEDFWVVPHDCICAGLGMQPPESSGAEVLSSPCKSSNDRLRRLHLFPRKCWDEQVNCMPEELGIPPVIRRTISMRVGLMGVRPQASLLFSYRYMRGVPHLWSHLQRYVGVTWLPLCLKTENSFIL